MNRARVLVIAGLWLCAQGAAAQDRGEAAVGGFHIGDAVDVTRLGAGWEVAGLENPATCAQVHGGTLPEGVSMMLLDGRVARFEIGLSGAPDEAAFAVSPYGLRLGMSLSEAGRRFPDESLELLPHSYAWPPGIYLTWRDERAGRGVRVEIPENTVTVVLWGTADAVQLVEGCA